MRKGKSCSRSFELGLSACGGKLHVHNFHCGLRSFACRSIRYVVIVSEVLRENIGVNARFASRDVEINFNKRVFAAVYVNRAIISRVSSVKIIRNSRYRNGSRLSAYECVFGEFRRNRGFAVFFVSDHDVVVRNPEEDTAVFISRSRSRSLH